MFKRLDNHIIVAICGSTLVVLFALMLIDMLGKIIAEIDILGDKDYHFAKLLGYVLGLIPLKLIEFFPMALLIGALMGLGKLAASSELTVMQTSGISRLRIGLIGFLVSVILGGIVLLITEYIGVSLHEKVTKMRAEALGEVSRNYGAGGIWAQSGNSFVNIGGVQADGQFADVSIYTLDEKMHLQTITHAKTAAFEQDNWKLSNTTEKTLMDNNIMVQERPTMRWENTLDSGVIGLLLSNPEDLSIRDLYRYIRYQKANDIKPTSYSLTFWQRIFVPLSTGVMFLLALPFVFGSQRSSSQGKKLFVGVMLGLAYFVSYTSIANIILLTGAPVILGAIIPIVLFAAVSFGLLWWRA